MNRTRLALAVLSVSALLPTAALEAQRRQPSPEERIDRLEKQVNQVQRRVYGKQPVDTAGFVLDPAVTQSDLAGVAARLDSLEQKMGDLLRTSEENANRVANLEAQLARFRAEADERQRAAEREAAAAPDDNAAAPVDSINDGPPPAPRPKVEKKDKPAVTAGDSASRPAKPGDADFAAAGEEAYDQGYQLWLQKKYDAAIASLRAMASSFPGHRRVSWANNLVGRALLDKGEARAAATVLLANYRGNPKGERAPDSLYYLGQASMKLGQPAQACKAYAELENVYGATLRPDLRRLLPPARAAANCS